MDNETIIDYLKKHLSEYRYIHTMGVAETAKQLAATYGADPPKAYTAGLLHDCAKELPFEEMLSVADKYKIETDELTKTSPALMHGIVGAYIAKEIFNADDEIFDAIAYHTTGKANMNLLTKIIYIADYIEPNRKFDGVCEIRELAFSDIDKAIISSCGTVIVHTVNKGGIVHPNTVDARNYLLLGNRSGADEKVCG